MGWKKLFLKVIKEDFLGHPVVKNLPSKAGDAGSDWGTKIPQAVGQLSPGATTKACAPQLTESPRAAVESSCEDPAQAK